MSDTTCPKCGYPRPEGAVDCPSCGIVYAKYGATPPPLPVAPPLPAAPGSGGFNPYAPPSAELVATYGGVYAGTGAGVWQRDGLLVMEKTAPLPARCLRCNRPVSRTLRAKLSWHPPAIYFVLLAHVLAYLVVALIVRKRAEVEVPMCDEHLAARKRNLILGWGTVAFSVLLAGWAIQAENGVGCVVVSVLLLAGLVVAVLAANVVPPKRIDDRFVWLKKVSPDYLAVLPPAPEWVPRL